MPEHHDTNFETPEQREDYRERIERNPCPRCDPDTRETYYGAAVAALETLLGRMGSISRNALDDRTEQWRRAYLHTPHGRPVELEAGR